MYALPMRTLMKSGRGGCRNAILLAAVACVCIGCGAEGDEVQDGWDVWFPSRDAEGVSERNTSEPPRDAAPTRDVVQDADADVGPANACGGFGLLTLDGADATPGEPCGCGGVVVCDGGSAVVCAGARAPNECGGCGPLLFDVGAACGPCGLGTWVCDGEEAIACDGGSEPNVCGGCRELEGAPGDPCESAVAPGLLVCTQYDVLSCLTPSWGRCDGHISELGDDNPADPCGTCNLGTMVCDGTTAVTCVETDAERNHCGGCAELPGVPGEACGECGGTWRCDSRDQNRLVCDGGRNRCGGCEPLTDIPAAGCTREDGTGGRVMCASRDEVVCGPAEGNACGGVSDLGVIVGETCGACEEGSIQCVSPEEARCIGARGENSCGGCGTLPGEPGVECGFEREWMCTADGSSECISVRRTDVNGRGGTRLRMGDIYVTSYNPGSELRLLTVERMPIVHVPGYVLTSPVARVRWDDPDDDQDVSLHLRSTDAESSQVYILEPGDVIWRAASVYYNTQGDLTSLYTGVEMNTQMFVGYATTAPCPEAEQNMCGGCEPLVGEFRESCGECGNGILVCGTWEDGFVCQGDERNACGGCSILGSLPGLPCGPCGLDALVCDGPEALTCPTETWENACGGCGPLEGAVGDPCGMCGLDELVCAPDGLSLVCDGDTRVNGCAGCNVEDYEVGEPCGACDRGIGVCVGTDLRCEIDTTLNACGGCAELAGLPFRPCEGCGASACSWQCDGIDAVACRPAE